MRAMPRIEQALPEARFIHIIRDGRDVALSQRERALDGDDVSRSPRSAERWQQRIRDGAASTRPSSIDYREVRYEDLVAEPGADAARHLRATSSFPSTPAMLRYYERAADRLTEIDRDLGRDGAPDPLRRASGSRASAMTSKPPSAALPPAGGPR